MTDTQRLAIALAAVRAARPKVIRDLTWSISTGTS